MSATKKDQKQHKNCQNTAMANQRLPNGKNQTHNKSTKNPTTMNPTIVPGLLSADNKPVTKTASTKLNRSQVSANWTNDAGALKSQQKIPTTNKKGKWHISLFEPNGLNGFD